MNLVLLVNIFSPLYSQSFLFCRSHNCGQLDSPTLCRIFEAVGLSLPVRLLVTAVRGSDASGLPPEEHLSLGTALLAVLSSSPPSLYCSGCWSMGPNGARRNKPSTRLDKGWNQTSQARLKMNSHHRARTLPKSLSRTLRDSKHHLRMRRALQALKKVLQKMELQLPIQQSNWMRP